MDRKKIYTTEHNTMVSFIEALDIERIKPICDEAVFHKGQAYYEDARVKKVKFVNENVLKSEVEGSNLYSVTLNLEEKDIYGNCDCRETDPVCKHLIGTLLYCLKNRNIQEIYEPQKDSVEKYLEALSKEKLIQIIMRFAPPSFIETIQMQQAPDEKVEDIVQTIEETIGALISDFQLLSQPFQFEQKLMRQLERLRAFWERFPQKIQAVIEYCINEMIAAFDNDYLYLYENDEKQYYESEDFSNYVVEFIYSVNFTNKVALIENLRQITKQSGYSTFESIFKDYSRFFRDEEVVELKKHVINSANQKNYNSLANYLRVVEPKLDADTKADVLLKTYFTDKKLTLKLVEFYIAQKQTDRALQIIIDIFDKENTQLLSYKLFVHYLDLARAASRPSDKYVWWAINDYPKAETLRKIAQIFPDKKEQYENFLKSGAPSEYLRYLEKENRLEDASHYILTEKFEQAEVLRFFRQYKKLFPKQAEKVFVEQIKSNLQYTDKLYYEKTSQLLKELQKVNDERFKDLVGHIKVKHQKNQELMQYINALVII